MIIPEFTAPSYGDRTLNEVQRCVNWYPEKTPAGWVLVGAPGLLLLGTVANDEPCRGAYLTSTGRTFSAHDDDLYEIPTVFPATDRGNLTAMSASSGPVRFCDNGAKMLIVDGLDGYVYDFVGNTLTTIVDANFPSNPTSCAFHDGYFVVTESGSDTFYVSALNDPSDWTPVTSAVEEGFGDNLTAVLSTGDSLVFIGVRTTVPWYNTGNASFPFERITGAQMKIGCNDTYSIAQMGKSIFMVGIGEGSGRSVWVLEGGAARKISPPYVDTAIFGGVAEGWVGQDNLGHRFYQINCPTTSWVYDIDQGTWWEKQSDVTGAGNYSTNRISHTTPNSDGTLVAFDSINGKVYQILSSVNTEDGTAIRRIKDFGPIGDGSTLIRHDRIEILLEADHDSTASYTLSGVLSWSDNGGLSFSSGITLSKAITSGTTGQLVRLYANRLGSSRKRIYRWTMTGPAARLVLKTCDLALQGGRH